MIAADQLFPAMTRALDVGGIDVNEVELWVEIGNLSVGVLLTQETVDEIYRKMLEGDDSPTAAKGELIEISQVSIPACSRQMIKPKRSRSRHM